MNLSSAIGGALRAASAASLGMGLAIAVSLLGSSRAQVIPSPTQIEVSVLPASGTLMITQTVQTVTLTVLNPAGFTNLSAQMQYGGPQSPLLDDGVPPDAAGGDAIFSANLVVPPFPAATPFTANFTTAGQDLAVTNEAGELVPESWVTNLTRVTYQAVTRPANDHFTNAIKIGPGGGWVTGQNAFATIEPAEPFHGDDPEVAASLWWTWSPTANGRVLVDTAGSGFAPVLAVYTGNSLPTLSLVAWSTNDVANGLKANVVFEARAGTTYRIAVAGHDATGVGAVRLGVIPGGAPDIGRPRVAILDPVEGVIVTTNRVVVSGTAEDPLPYATGIAAVQVSVNDGSMAVATGLSDWSAAVTLERGTNLVQALALDVAGNESPPVLLTIIYLDPPNDLFTSGVPLTGLAGVAVVSNEGATKEPGEPPHAGNEGGHSIWYRFLAPAAGTLHLSTVDSSVDTLLAVYEGDGLTSLTLVGSNDDAAPGSGFSRLDLAARRGHLYHVAVDGFGEATGWISLSFDFTAEETLYALVTLPALGGVIEPASGQFVEGTVLTLTALPARNFEFRGWGGSVESLANPLTLVMTQDFTVTATFQIMTYVEGFESGTLHSGLPWATAGSAPWFVQSEVTGDGRYAARSGVISHGQQSALTVKMRVLAGTGAFRLRVSSEEGWDGLEFYLDNRLQRRWTGETGWELYQFPVSEGLKTFEWRYVKDANFSVGLDAACLDDLYLPFPDQERAPVLGVAKLDAGGVLLTLQGYPGQPYVIQATPDLAVWAPIFTNSSPGGSWVWPDPLAPILPARSYRALVP